MNKIIVLLALVFSTSAFAVLPDQTLALHKFKGYWPGTGTVQMTGGPLVNFSGYQKCKVVADGWSVQCVGHWEGDYGFLLEESFQGAYDIATNLINWQVMYSQGPQAFTVYGLFNAAKTELPLGRTFTTPDGTVVQDGKWTFLTNKHRTLYIDTYLNGSQVSHLTADVSK